MPVHATASSFSEAIIRVDEVLDAVNALPDNLRWLVLNALRERSPIYCWALDHRGRLTCRDEKYPVNPPQLRQWASDDDS